MIDVTIYKDKSGYIRGYNVSGHAEYDVYGKDIVCAAVSVLAQTALISLIEVCHVSEDDINYIIDEDKGILDTQISKVLSPDIFDNVEVVLKTFEVGIKSIIESYPKYVTLRYKEE